jgi:hypothetical protein
VSFTQGPFTSWDRILILSGPQGRLDPNCLNSAANSLSSCHVDETRKQRCLLSIQWLISSCIAQEGHVRYEQISDCRGLSSHVQHRDTEFPSFSFGIHLPSLCGLLVRVPGYRSGGPGSIPGATRFSEK